MAKVSSKNIELKVLALLMQAPLHIKAISLDLDTFAYDEHRRLGQLIQQYVRKYKSVPSKETLIAHADSSIRDEASLEVLPGALEVLDRLPKVTPPEAAYYFDKAKNLLIGRKTCDLHDLMTRNFEKNDVDFVKLRQKILRELLLMGANEEGIKRNYIYRNTEDRWENYKMTTKGQTDDLIPFGMGVLDNIVKGMKKSFVTLIYSKTGGGKSRFGINVAYNAAQAGFNVMVVSLEMGFDILANCFDSRIASVDSHKIIFGGLPQEDKKRFSEALKKQVKEKLNIWISDIPQHATIGNVYEEIEIYEAANGIKPDLVIVDYANLLEPTMTWHNRSEKYDYLFQEFKEVARFHNVALLTMMQESRDATKAYIKNSSEKQKKEEEIDGVHNIGLSNYAATHCETVLHLKQTHDDGLANCLRVSVNKNRYGKALKTINLFCAFDKTYVGDRELLKTHAGTSL